MSTHQAQQTKLRPVPRPILPDAAVSAALSPPSFTSDHSPPEMKLETSKSISALSPSLQVDVIMCAPYPWSKQEPIAPSSSVLAIICQPHTSHLTNGRFVHKRLFQIIYYLRNVDRGVCVQIALRLNGGVMAPGELTGLRSLYVIESGIVLYGGKVLGSGRIFGADDIILTPGLLKFESHDRGRAMTYTDYRQVAAHIP